MVGKGPELGTGSRFREEKDQAGDGGGLLKGQVLKGGAAGRAGSGGRFRLRALGGHGREVA